MKTIELRPSEVMAHEVCPRKGKLQYIDGLRPEVISANRLFGTAMHNCIDTFVHESVLKSAFISAVDMARMFIAKFEKLCASTPVSYATEWPEGELIATGRTLVGQFPDFWRGLELTPAIDLNGRPLIERRLKVELAPGVVLSCQPDFIGYDREARLVIPDWKSASVEATPEFVLMSDQLTAYEITVNANADRLGIPPVEALGFIEGIKKHMPKKAGAGPHWAEPTFVDARPEQQKHEYIEKVVWMADDIRDGRFPKRPLWAFNSPCRDCDFKQACASGSMEGLCSRSDKKLAA